MLLLDILTGSGLEKSLFGCLGHKAVDYPFGQVTFHSHLPDQANRQVVHQLNH